MSPLMLVLSLRPYPHIPVKLVAQVMFRLKFLEALMNMSRSRFGCGKWGEDARVVLNYHFIMNNKIKYARHEDIFSQKAFHCERARARARTHTHTHKCEHAIWKEIKQLLCSRFWLQLLRSGLTEATFQKITSTLFKKKPEKIQAQVY